MTFGELKPFDYFRDANDKGGVWQKTLSHQAIRVCLRDTFKYFSDDQPVIHVTIEQVDTKDVK